MPKKQYDFAGWATRNNMRCSDGRTIMANAFKHCDGKSVPLIWNHQHDDPEAVLGHADLVNKEGGVYAYCTFNDTKNGEISKALVKHGDIVALSIYANHVTETPRRDVLHGDICEVSLVHKGANPGAFIDTPEVLMHGDTDRDAMIIFCTESGIEFGHADSDDDEKKKEEEKMPAPSESEKDTKGKTLKEVFDTMNEEQQNVCYAMVGMALEDAEGKKSNDDDKEEKEMKHNSFDQGEVNTQTTISHADQKEILDLMRNPQVGTWKNAINIYCQETELAHGDVSGFSQDVSEDGNITWLFPEFKDVKPGAPELLTNDQGWVNSIISKVTKSPMSRIRTRQVDIRNIEGSMDSLRGRGFQKGNNKRLAGNYKLARRTTDPQTVYVRSALHRDDIIDITDFDYVKWQYNIDRLELNEELATAMLFGDSREDSDPDKIFPEHIRPIWTDDEIYTMHKDIDIAGARAAIQGTNTSANFGDNYIYAEAVITAMLYAREKYKGSGQPDMYCTPHMVNVMLLARDLNGRRIYDSVSELASALNVANIYTVEQMEGKTRVEGEGASAVTKKLVALVCNMKDYTLGSTKGGEITHFTDFDIKTNTEESLLETRVSGANTRLYSVIALEEEVNPN